MAIFRKIHVTFWSDAYVSDLKEKEKLFYLYLLTNERTTQIGCYEITKKQISYDLGYSIDTVSILLNKFQKDGKIRYNERTCEVAIKNWLKYNENTSIKVKVLTDKQLSIIKDKTLIQYLYSMDTVSIHNPQEEEEQEEEKEETKEQEQSKELTTVSDFEILEPFPFDDFWSLYDKKQSRDKCESKYNRLSTAEKEKIFETLPLYIASTPDKKFRKNPETYLNNKSWNDEVIIPNATTKPSYIEHMASLMSDTSLEDYYRQNEQ